LQEDTAFSLVFQYMGYFSSSSRASLEEILSDWMDGSPDPSRGLLCCPENITFLRSLIGHGGARGASFEAEIVLLVFLCGFAAKFSVTRKAVPLPPIYENFSPLADQVREIVER